jgi:hypothetical protein
MYYSIFLKDLKTLKILSGAGGRYKENKTT